MVFNVIMITLLVLVLGTFAICSCILASWKEDDRMHIKDLLEQALKDYEEQQIINEEHQRINGELREENKQLKERISEIEEAYETQAEAKYYDYIDKHESKLQKRIDEAIEYIKQNSELVKVDSIKHFDFYYREMKDVTELLEILKGDSNE